MSNAMTSRIRRLLKVAISALDAAHLLDLLASSTAAAMNDKVSVERVTSDRNQCNSALARFATDLHALAAAHPDEDQRTIREQLNILAPKLKMGLVKTIRISQAADQIRMVGRQCEERANDAPPESHTGLRLDREATKGEAAP